ncbi:hypothetical protein COHA_005076 [Chlorella ohadii]|uniref:Uncharacterized protein n=1 Tax=Chlorella ohadii TaxID=2649997 RepID=A0AAD5DRR8_9CHLO|nr:hypothetical protein COHA_005076 [Chlorella ohadii]
MNLAVSIAVYASISKELGLPLRFPGTAAAWNGLVDVIDADLLADAMVHLATTEACANQAFNISNGDCFRWKDMWPAIAAWFCMETAPPVHLPLTQIMADKGEVWQRLVDKHGLQDTPYDKLATWQFMAFVFDFPGMFACLRARDWFSNTNKLRRTGFHGMCVDSDAMFGRLFQKMRDQKATTGEAFSIALAIYAAVCLGLLLAFTWWRRAPWAKRFYAPKLFVKPGQPRPKPIGMRYPLAWVTSTVSAPEAAVVKFAGVDALMYLKILQLGIRLCTDFRPPPLLPLKFFCAYSKILQLGIRLFAGVSLLVLATVLPVNLTGGQVSRLVAAQPAPVPASQFTYWLPAPPPPPAESDQGFSVENTQPKVVEPPAFYVHNLPPAPAGVEWFGWRYDASYQAVQYRFSDLDKVTMSNIEAGSKRLYAHAVLAWAVSLYALRLLWRANQDAVRLRVYYLLNRPPGAESHTVLLTDIPGIAYGTVPHRIDHTLLRFLPRRVKSWIVGAASQGVRSVGSTLKLGAGWVAETAGKAVRQLASGATIQEVVDREMRSIFGNEFDHASLVCDTSSLDPLLSEYGALMRSATDLIDHYVGLKLRNRDIKPIKAGYKQVVLFSGAHLQCMVGTRLHRTRTATQLITVVPAKWGGWGLQRYGASPRRVDALQHYRDRLAEVWRQMAEEREGALLRVAPSAFVTFRTRGAQVAHVGAGRPERPGLGRLASLSIRALSSLLPILHHSWRMWERAGRRALAWAAFVALSLFYIIPVTAVQSLLALNSVTGWLASVPVLNALVTAILPGLALKIFVKLLPCLLALLNRHSGMVSAADIDLSVVTKYFIFQVITVFFGSFIAGSFANQIRQLVKSPGSILTVLGTAAPQTAIFFTTYVMLQALLAKPLSLLRLWDLVVYWLRSRLAATERAKARAWSDQCAIYGGLIPGRHDTVTMLLGLVFCLIYVKGEQYQSGGQAWPRVLDQLCFALALLQLTMMAILGIKRTVVPPLIVLPLLPITGIFWLACRALFGRAQQTLGLADAAQLDATETEAEAADGPASGATAAGRREQAKQARRQAERSALSAECTAPTSLKTLLPFSRPSRPAHQEADAMLHFLATGAGGEELEAIQARATATMDAAAFVTAQEEAAAEGPWEGAEGFPDAQAFPPHRAASSGYGPRRRGSSGAGPARTTSGGGEVVMMHNAAAGVRGTTGSADEAGVGSRQAERSLDVELGTRQHSN